MKWYGFFFLLCTLPLRAEVCEDGVESFKKTLHPELVANCASCHGDQGFAIRHSMTDYRAAYPVAKGLVDFTQIQNSKLYTKVVSAHWLNYNPNAKGMTVAQMDKALGDWWDGGEKKCPSAFSYETESLDISDNLPQRSSGNFQELIFDLEKTSGSLKGCSFSVSGQIFMEESETVPRSYRFKNPKVKCESGRYSIKGIRIVIDGSTQSFENVYDQVDQEIVGNGEYESLSEELMIVIARLSAKKKISVGFGEFKKLSSP